VGLHSVRRGPSRRGTVEPGDQGWARTAFEEGVAMTVLDDEPGFSLTAEDDEEGLVPREVQLCPGCGRPRARWEKGGAGFDAGEDGRWCCGGCYEETGCTCGN